MKNSNLILSAMVALSFGSVAMADHPSKPVESRCEDGDVQLVASIVKKDKSARDVEIKIQDPLLIEQGETVNLSLRIRNRNPNEKNVGPYYLPTVIYSALSGGLGSMGMQPAQGSLNVYLMPQAGMTERFTYNMTGIQQRLPKGWNLYNILDKCQAGTVTVTNKTNSDLVKQVAEKSQAVVAAARSLVDRASGFDPSQPNGRASWKDIRPTAVAYLASVSNLQAAAQQGVKIKAIRELHTSAKAALRAFRRATMIGDVTLHTNSDFRAASATLREVSKLVDPDSIINPDARISVYLIKPGFEDGSFGPRDGLAIGARTSGLKSGTIVDIVYGTPDNTGWNNNFEMPNPTVDQNGDIASSAPVKGDFTRDYVFTITAEDAFVLCRWKGNDQGTNCQSF